MRIDDLVLEIIQNFRKQKLRTFLTTGGIAVGTFAITLMVGLGIGVHDFIEVQLRSMSDPLSLEVLHTQLDTNSWVQRRLTSLGQPPRKMEKKNLELLQSFRGGFEPFTHKEVDDILQIEGVAEVAPFIWVIADGIRLLEEGNTGRGDGYTGPMNEFDDDYYEITTLVRPEQASFRLSYGQGYQTGGRQIILAHQYAEAFGIPAEALVGRTVELLIPELKNFRRYSWILPSRVAGRYQTFHARVAAVTERTILSTIGFVPPAFGQELYAWQFVRAEDRGPGPSMVGELLSALQDPQTLEALESGGALNPEDLERLKAIAGVLRLMAPGGLDGSEAIPPAEGQEEAAPAGEPAQAEGDRVFSARLNVIVRSEADLPGVREALTNKGFTARSLRDNLEAVAQIFGVLDAFLASFGVIALLVAALGIINTLHMAIFERTSEIGVMKAMGATERTIRWLFALEAAAIGLVGGILGVAAGALTGWLFNRFGTQLLVGLWGGFDFFQLPLYLVGGTIAFATIIGFLAGLYPAYKAARLDPIAALRQE